MSYEERVEWFWGRVQALRLDSYQIALWFGLLKFFNEAGFPTRCEVENEVLCTLLGIEIRTLRAARKRLIENNLIAYEAGNAKKQPAYIIDMELYASLHPAPKIIEKPQQRVVRKPKKVQEVIEPVLFREEKKKSKPKKVQEVSPTLQEVVKICTDKGMSEDDAEKFFYY